MKNSILTLVLLLTGLVIQAQQKTTAPVIVKKLSLGKSIIVHTNYSVDFLEVTEDSRCPTGTECIWAGQAKVMLMICKDGEEMEKKEVILKDLSTENPFQLTLAPSLKVNIYQLKPHPTIESKNNLDYYLQIAEAKN